MPLTHLEQDRALGPEAGDAAIAPGASVPGTNSRPGTSANTVRVATALTTGVARRGGAVATRGVGGAQYAVAVPAPAIPGTPAVAYGVISGIEPKPTYRPPPTYIEPQALHTAKPLAIAGPTGVGVRTPVAAPPPNTVSVAQVLPQPKGLIL